MGDRAYLEHPLRRALVAASGQGGGQLGLDGDRGEPPPEHVVHVAREAQRASTTASSALTWLASSRSTTIPSIHSEARTVNTKKPATSSPTATPTGDMVVSPKSSAEAGKSATMIRWSGWIESTSSRAAATTNTADPWAAFGSEVSANTMTAALTTTSGPSRRHDGGGTSGQRCIDGRKAANASALTASPPPSSATASAGSSRSSAAGSTTETLNSHRSTYSDWRV